MKRFISVFAVVLLSLAAIAQSSPANQPAVIRPGDNLVVENIPPIPASIAEKANQYGEFRAANLLDWNPQQREMLIGTRFADVPQIHLVKMPGGARAQLTFFPDRITGAQYDPANRSYFIFSKDIGGGEWFQFYRYDSADGNVTLLTDGKSRNLGARFAHHDNRFAYTSTRRTGQDTDVWVMDATDPKTDRMLLQLQGGGWRLPDWSPDKEQVLVQDEVCISQ